MSMGPTHDKLTYRAAVLGAVAVAYLGYGWGVAATLAAFTLISGLWLNPDLDNQSIALKRWGCFAFIWRPYAYALPHRSPLSHWPIIGTVGRVVYVAVAASLLIIAAIIGIYAALSLAALVGDILQQQPIRLTRAIQTADYWMGLTWERVEAKTPRIDLTPYLTKSRVIAALIGLELGNSTHFGADQISTTTKRFASWLRPGNRQTYRTSGLELAGKRNANHYDTKHMEGWK